MSSTVLISRTESKRIRRTLQSVKQSNTPLKRISFVTRLHQFLSSVASTKDISSISMQSARIIFHPTNCRDVCYSHEESIFTHYFASFLILIYLMINIKYFRETKSRLSGFGGPGPQARAGTVTARRRPSRAVAELRAVARR